MMVINCSRIILIRRQNRLADHYAGSKPSQLMNAKILKSHPVYHGVMFYKNKCIIILWTSEIICEWYSHRG